MTLVYNMPKVLHFKDNQYEFKGITHTREISRGVIFNDEYKVAIIKLYSNDIFGIRDCYETPGGGVKPGETHEEAIKREAIEEVGYEVEVIQELSTVIDYYNLIQRENHNHYFLAKAKKYVGSNREEYENKMFQGIEFVSIDEAIDKFTNKMFGKTGLLVQQRELPILKEVKIILDNMKNHRN